MSLLERACETYNYAADRYAGVYEEGKREPLAPIAHSITNASIEITIDKNGRFVDASEVAQEDAKTIFPVTEKSLGRTSSPEPHPLCDQMQYLSPEEQVKYTLYMEQLEKWKSSTFSHPFVDAIYSYVKNGTIMTDLQSTQIKKLEGKSFVRWRVIGVEGETEDCWKNVKLHNCFISFYCNQNLERNSTGICMISGDESRLATQHAKGIVSVNGNAKLISSNDGTNFTYRGRFLNDSEALTIGYEASQKGHNALRWLIANQAENQNMFGGRVFLCWNPEGKKIPMIMGRMLPAGMKISEAPKIYIPSDYKKWMKDILNGWKNNLADISNIVIAVFDAATSGRLALTYYSELTANDFLERLSFWDSSCCYLNYKWGIQTPVLLDIAKFSLGTYRGNGFEIDEKIMKQAMLRLLTCRIEKARFPTDIERLLVGNAGNLQLYDKETRNKLLFTVCAVIKKYQYDYKKEEWLVALEPEKKDRSYQYGRLLAVLEKEEKDTYRSDEEGRETNAIRMQSVFVKRPQYASRILVEQIKRSYLRRLSASSQVFYEKLVGEIMDRLSEFSDELDKPLEDTYLLGYYMQKNDLYKKNKEEENE